MRIMTSGLDNPPYEHSLVDVDGSRRITGTFSVAELYCFGFYR